jgi:hypothetical protein
MGVEVIPSLSFLLDSSTSQAQSVEPAAVKKLYVIDLAGKPQLADFDDSLFGCTACKQ